MRPRRPKMRPKTAKMRPKTARMRPKTARMRPEMLRMAKMKFKMTKMRLQKAPQGSARLRPIRPPLPPTSLIPCLEDATFDAVLLFFGSCFELGALSSEGRVLGAPVVRCNLDF